MASVELNPASASLLMHDVETPKEDRRRAAAAIIHATELHLHISIKWSHPDLDFIGKGSLLDREEGVITLSVSHLRSNFLVIRGKKL